MGVMPSADAEGTQTLREGTHLREQVQNSGYHDMVGILVGCFSFCGGGIFGEMEH